ncbi:Mov34/MPN/PAD-1 family protein [Halolamina sp. CBA1230]|uniref:Mov34/MPN/PAD-1 family protein n=1 Tax=Halolamina sp. CBA1230 TaxID=1853690 RepID=UPI0009A17592|nr:Mov34/MPN/PAD-1 family protein [Halolamina sp. CBA1230]QKY19186.1 Mov34/MPN/PAD-1 family protein [Halolamina sp. CBA1230]
MGLFRSGDVVGIADDALTFALEASRETHPDEYMGLLRGEPASEYDVDHDGLLVTDVLIIPGTESNPVSATVKTSMIPNDFSSVGSIHSHPNGVLQPSQADLATFGKGQVHIIVGHPYGRDDWVALDREGKRRSLPVYDVEMDDPEDFFDFTQEDIDAELGIDEDEL